MSLFLLGLNHKTAPLDVRERVAFSEELSREILPQLADGEIASEALVLSTCNRVEILVESSIEKDALAAHLFKFVSGTHDLSHVNFTDCFYQLSEREVVRHLFRVASSLDSLVVGETQILGQVRQAYKIAAEAGTAKRNLHKLLHHAFHTAKRVRTETEIGGNAVSIASAAVELARKTFGSLDGKRVLIIGAGEMARAAARSVKGSGGQISICNRTLETAITLAMDCEGTVVPFDKLREALSQADVVICSTSAGEYLITSDDFAETEKDSFSLLIDISVPRNIAPEVKAIKNVQLVDVDDLESAVATNMQKRLRHAEQAEAIVETEVEEFWRSMRMMNMGERLGLLREKMQDAARGEFTKHRSRLGDLTAEQEQAVENLLLSAVNKISHPILYGLRRSHENTEAEEFVEILCSLLGGEETEHR